MFASSEIADDLLQFSPPFLHQEDPFSHFLPQQLAMETLDISSAQETMLNKSNVHHEAINDKNAEPSKRVYRKNARTPRRRAGKKDRHSKIVTAQGTRDRRLRLSLEIARKFFNLQDMLGFGIASKTVEWLLKQSEASIDELKQACTIETKTAFSFSTPECDQVSAHKGVKGKNLDGNVSKWRPVNKAPSGRDARDLRVQARARARERTLEKMKMEKPKQPCIQEHSHYLNQFLSSDPFPEVVDKLRGSCSSVRTSTQVLAKYSHPPRHPGPTGDVVSKSFVINSVSRPSLGVSSYSNTILPNFQENWSNEIAKMSSPICYANRMLEVNSMGSIGRPNLV